MVLAGYSNEEGGEDGASDGVADGIEHCEEGIGDGCPTVGDTIDSVPWAEL